MDAAKLLEVSRKGAEGFCRVRLLGKTLNWEAGDLKEPEENPLRVVCELRASRSEEGTDGKSGGRL